MNKLLIKKIKTALKSTRPIESIKEVVSEFEEIERLVKWREDILLSGNIEKHKKELDRIVDLMVKYGYPYDIHEDSIEAMIRKHIKNFK
jgi:hypothetical protein